MLSHIKRIEIELQSKCNRKCPWCPNTEFLRDRSIRMEESLYINLIEQIKENNFTKRSGKGTDKYISFNRFCEPMYDITLLKKRLEQALEIMPDAQYLINTNGDFMSKENLDGLYLDKLNIMDYDCKGIHHWKNRLKELGVVIVYESNPEGKLIGVHKNIGRVTCEVDWPLHAMLEDRSGYLDKDVYHNGLKMKWRNNKEKRTVPCIEPQFYISIDYNGNVVPCCHFRSDNPSHEKFIWGNIKDTKLTEIINCSRATTFKSVLATGEPNKYPKECLYCNKIRGIQVETLDRLNKKSFMLKDHEL